jgi:hypothetical protein
MMELVNNQVDNAQLILNVVMVLEDVQVEHVLFHNVEPKLHVQKMLDINVTIKPVDLIH